MANLARMGAPRRSAADRTGIPVDQLEDRLDRAALGGEHQQRALACAAVLRSARVILRRIETALQPHGLTAPGYEVLGLLSVSEGQQLPIVKLRQQIFVHSASVTHHLDGLQRDGLVERRPHPTDGRSTVVALTPAGIAKARDVYDALGAIGFGFGELDDASTAALARLVAGIGGSEPPRP